MTSDDAIVLQLSFDLRTLLTQRVALERMPAFSSVNCYKAVAQHVAVGMGAASFWRGAWYLLDDHLFPEDAAKSAGASLGLGIAGMYASQGLMARAERLAKTFDKIPLSSSKQVQAALLTPSGTPMRLAAARFGTLYTVALSCVLVWRGTWVGWDVVYERLHPEEATSATDPGHATKSGLLSHVTAMTLLLGTGVFASVLAPPAAVSVIRDFAVKAGQTYTGPAQAVAQRLFAGASPRGSISRAMSTATPRRSAASRFRRMNR